MHLKYLKYTSKNQNFKYIEKYSLVEKQNPNFIFIFNLQNNQIKIF